MSRNLTAALLTCAASLACSGPARVDTPDVDVAFPTLETPSLAAPSLSAPPVLLAGATVLTGDGRRLEPGYVLLQDGRIQHVGDAPPSDLPDDTRRFDLDGHTITPGLIDTHSHLGVYAAPSVSAHSDGNEATSPITAEVSSEHSVWPQDPGFQRALAGGVTSLQILPGSANLIGGRAVTLKLHPARDAAGMRFPGAPTGIKMACGENPKRVYGDRGGPGTRMASTARMRAAFTRAQKRIREWDDYREKLEGWDGADPDAKPDPPTTDLELDTLAAVLRGEILVHIHCYRADEMLTQLALAEEFGYRIRSFHHAVEAYKIRDVLAEREVSVSTWADWWGFKIEAYDAIQENIALLHLEGGRAIVHSDSARGIQRLNQEAAKALYRARESGLEVTPDDALRWITLNPAWALGVHEETGSLEVGKMADVVVWSGDPFSVYTLAELVFVDGVLEYERASDPEPWSDFEADTRAPIAVPADSGGRP